MTSSFPEMERSTKRTTKECKWKRCQKDQFKTIEELLEHVLTEHIPVVRKNEDGEEEVLCEWEDCETSTSRGSLQKKVCWMRDHFKTRHAKSAKTFKCLFEGCAVVKSSSQEIETHVRLFHPAKPKKEVKKEVSPDPVISTNPPVQNRIWRVVDGKIEWDPPMRVTKKTIVHYDDGPRYVFPSGCSRCNYDSDESELASDEYWSAADLSDLESGNQSKVKRSKRIKKKKEAPVKSIERQEKVQLLPETPFKMISPSIFDLYPQKSPKPIEKRKRVIQHSDESDSELVDKQLSQSKKKKKTKERRRPSRACKRNISLCEMDEQIEAAFEVLLEAEDSFIQRKQKVQKVILFKSEETGMKKRVNVHSRPSRACRVQGSLEEVPYHMEIGV